MDIADPVWGRSGGGAVEWPQGPGGRPEPEALLETAPDLESYAGLLLSRLEAAGIPARTNLSQRGGVGRLFGGFSLSGVEIYVPVSRLEEAKALLGPAEDAGETK